MNIKLNETNFKPIFLKNKKLRKNSDVLLTKPINENEKIIGYPKHILPYNKEWSNSAYSYNKNYMANIPVKANQIDKTFRDYMHLTFYLAIKDKHGMKRIRTIRKKVKIDRRSLHSILTSKPEIKHTNDKVIINFYVLDREKELLTKKLSFSSKKKFLFVNKTLELHLNNITKNLKTNNETSWFKKGKFNFVLKKIISRKTRQKLLTKKLFKPKAKYKNNIANLEQRLVVSLMRKMLFIRNVFFYMFLKSTLRLFKIKIFFVNSKPRNFVLIQNAAKAHKKFLLIEKDFSLNLLKKLNNILLSLLLNLLNNKNKKAFLKKETLLYLFIYYKNQYFVKFLNKYLFKQIMLMHQMFAFSLNNFKTETLIPFVKTTIDKIIDRKVELNIVNLKYLHLNSNLFTKAIAIRLRKKTSILLSTIKRSLNLIRLPLKVSRKNSLAKLNIGSVRHLLDNSKYKNINCLFKDSSLDIVNKDIVNASLLHMFNFLTKNNNFYPTGLTNDNKEANIFNGIRYKWVKGARVEAKGRLTKRYTASRSVFKYRYKGNLRDPSFYGDLYNWMSRADKKSNLQYSFINSKKHIGAFGIKGWISAK